VSVSRCSGPFKRSLRQEPAKERSIERSRIYRFDLTTERSQQPSPNPHTDEVRLRAPGPSRSRLPEIPYFVGSWFAPDGAA
jgi:hypothetical protein